MKDLSRLCVLRPYAIPRSLTPLKRGKYSTRASIIHARPSQVGHLVTAMTPKGDAYLTRKNGLASPSPFHFSDPLLSERHSRNSAQLLRLTWLAYHSTILAGLCDTYQITSIAELIIVIQPDGHLVLRVFLDQSIING